MFLTEILFKILRLNLASKLLMCFAFNISIRIFKICSFFSEYLIATEINNEYPLVERLFNFNNFFQSFLPSELITV